MTQVFLAILSLTAVLCTQDRNATVRKWGPVFGLCSQPFWLYAAWTSQQWGIFVISFVYTAIWCMGVWRQWIRPRWPEPQPKLYTQHEVYEIMERRLREQRERLTR